MENKNINTTPAKGNAGRNWAIAGVVAIALILGMGYINRTDISTLNDISPAAGEAAPATSPNAPSFDGNMPPQPTPAPGVE